MEISVNTPVEEKSFGNSQRRGKTFKKLSKEEKVKGLSTKSSICCKPIVFSLDSALTFNKIVELSTKSKIDTVSRNTEKGIKPRKCRPSFFSKNGFPRSPSIFSFVQGLFKKNKSVKSEKIKKNTKIFEIKSKKLPWACEKKARVMKKTNKK